MEDYNPKENPIIVKCKGATTVSLGELKQFQGGLKKLTRKNRDRLAKSILTLGFIAPVFIWDRGGEYLLLDGHQRVATLFYLESHGWYIPGIPAAYIHAENEKDARRKLLHITSQYGDFFKEELAGWLKDLDSDIKESLRFMESEVDLTRGVSSPLLNARDYSKKITSPLYEVKGRRPKVSALVDTTKTDELLAVIKESDIKSPAVKRFLTLAAYRHLVFSYQDIAEFYAHADTDVQALMEASALIILDVKKAIAGGFVKLLDDFSAAFDEKDDADAV